MHDAVVVRQAVRWLVRAGVAQRERSGARRAFSAFVQAKFIEESRIGLSEPSLSLLARRSRAAWRRVPGDAAAGSVK